MVLEVYRKEVEPYLKGLAKYIRDANPNNLSILALLFAVFAGVAFILSNINQLFLLVAALFIFLNGLFDALDGKVAKLSRRASPKGDFLDHVLDRYADVFIIGGIMLSPYCTTVIGLFAIVGIIFASYMGTQSQAVGCGRRYAGVLSRADRLAILIFAPMIQYILLLPGKDFFTLVIFEYRFTFLEVVMIGFAILGHVTAIQRIYWTWQELGRTPEQASKQKRPSEGLNQK